MTEKVNSVLTTTSDIGEETIVVNKSLVVRLTRYLKFPLGEEGSVQLTKREELPIKVGIAIAMAPPGTEKEKCTSE